MSTKLTPFAFGDQLVRVITDEHGNPWFVAKDVCHALGCEWNGAARIAHVPEEWRVVTSVVTTFGTKETWLLSEQGLYFFLGRSDKPGALPFQKWMAGDVMPTLRKTGTYTMPKPEPAISEPAPPVLPIPEHLPHKVPDIQLPESALLLRPTMRMRLWQDALQSARLEGAGMQYAVECFVKLCTVMAMTPKIKESPARTEIKAFIQAQCRHSPGVNTRSHILYEAFRIWRKGLGTGLGKGYMPSHKVFGETMGLYYAKLFSNGSWYRDVSLASCSAPA